MTDHLRYKGGANWGEKSKVIFQFQKRPGRFLEKIRYSLNDNIVRGAAKSLATLPTAWMDNITETTEVLALSLSQYYSRHRGVFQISSSF